MSCEHCAAKIGWRVPGGHTAGWTHRTRSIILRTINISESLYYVAMARSDEEGPQKWFSTARFSLAML